MRVVCIPLTEFRVSANWDPILDDSEKKSPMFLMMKSNKDENLSKNVRIEKLFGLIVEPEENRRGSQKIVKHRIAEYVHPLMKNDDKVEILNWLLHRTFKKWMHTKVIPLAHKLFLLYQLLEKSDELFVTNPVRDWNAPAPLQDFRTSYLDRLEERVLEDSLKNRSGTTSGKKSAKKETYTQPGSSLTHFPICSRVVKSKPTWFLSRIKGENCPKCGHAMLVAVESQEQIENKRKIVMADYTLSMEIWAANGKIKSQKPGKPTKVVPEQHIVCMCAISCANDSTTGKGCKICEDFVDAHGYSNWDFQRGESTCTVCNCRCNCYFSLSKWSSVQLMVEEEKQKKESAHVEEVTSKNSKQGVLDKFIANAKEAMNRNELAANGGAILMNKKLNDDTPMRNEMQKILPRSSPFVNLKGGSDDKHINQHRKDKKKNTNNCRVYNGNLDPNFGNPLVSSSRTESTDSFIGKSIGQNPTSSSDTVESLSNFSAVYKHHQQSWDQKTTTCQQQKPFRDAIEVQLKERRDLSPDERNRLHRIYKITCGEQEPMANVINTIATEAITEIVTVYGDYNQVEATAHCVKIALDRMITMMISMGE